jgi:chemotaxis-related protein WspD
VKHSPGTDHRAATTPKIYDQLLPAGYAESNAEFYAQPAPDRGVADATPLFIFRIGPEWLGLATGVIDTITDLSAIHRLPHRQVGVLHGLANIHGRLEPCVSLAALLGITAQARGYGAGRGHAYPRLVRICKEQERFAFPVEEVLGICRYKPDELIDVPATLALTLARYSRGILPLGDKRVGCLDESLLFNALIRSLA